MASPDVLKEYAGRVNKLPDILLAEVVLTRTWNRDGFRLRIEPTIFVITAQLRHRSFPGNLPLMLGGILQLRKIFGGLPVRLLTRAPCRHSHHLHRDSCVYLPRHHSQGDHRRCLGRLL